MTNIGETRAIVEGNGPRFYSPHCPRCFELIDLQAAVSKFKEQPNWQFWGEIGKRFIVCKAGNYVHFKTILSNGKTSHRVAWLE